MSTRRSLALISGLLLTGLSACATAPKPDAGYLSRYDNLGGRGDGLRASVRQWSDAEALKTVSSVRLQPTAFLEDADASRALTPAEQRGLLREIDAQLCFELSERFAIAGPGAAADAEVRSAVTWFLPTGRAASAASAAAAFFIPGPIDLRAPGTLGALGAEAEMTTTDGRQIAAIAWARQANAIGTDAPSLMKAGDALQFAEPFADDAARVMTPTPAPDIARFESGQDPCRAYGPRIRAGSFVTKVITNLYVPQSTEGPAEPAGAAEAP
ncbi:MAG: DUF3313 family protein [Caulobacter sp.]|nr:DUF3313 family protein [Caulobacter sp.]